MHAYVEKENGYKNEFPTALSVSVFVCVSNTSNGSLMIGLIDTQQ